MKTLIAYASKYGATEKAAHMLAEMLNGTTELHNLKTSQNLDAASYDRIIIGGSIYAGTIQKQVQEFCSANMQQLLEKSTSLFICCGEEKRAMEQLEACFDPRLVEKAEQKGHFGYIYDFKKINFLFKLILKKVAGVKESKSALNEQNIRDFAAALNT